MTVADLIADVSQDTGLAATATLANSIRISANINKAYRRILRDPVCEPLRTTMNQNVTFASIADQAVYGMPSSIAAVRVLTERDTQRKLWACSIAELRGIDPGRTATGPPDRFAPVGYKPFFLPFAAAGSGVWVASASGADTTQTLQLNAVRAGGLMTGDITANLNGATRVAVGTITDIVDLQMVSLSAVAAGVVSLYNASSGGDIIAQIGIGEKTSQYYAIELFPTPQSAITYYIDGDYRIPVLDDTTDIPLLPEEFHDLLGVYARMKEYEKSDDSRYQVAESEWNKGLNDLKFRVSTQAGQITAMGARMPRHSRYGAWFPADNMF